MNILYLGPWNDALIAFLSSGGDHIIHKEHKIGMDDIITNKIEFIISYGYRYIIGEDVIKSLPKRIINLHISYLPWNRGADPNLWSFLEDTPKGVSIHYVSKALDKGDIIIQKEVFYHEDDTLRTSYMRLKKEVEQLLLLHWEKIREGMIQSFPQPPGGTYHSKKDRKKVEYLLTDGWDTPIINLIGKFKLNQV